MLQTKKKNHDIQKKVKGKGTHPGYTFHLNLKCTHPMVVTVSTQTPMVRSTTESIPVTIYKLAMGQFTEVLHPTTRSLNDNPPPLEDIPSVPVRQGTPWPMQDWHQRIYMKTERTGLFPLLQPLHPPPPLKQKKTQICSNPSCHDNAQISQRKMLMGTTLFHL